METVEYAAGRLADVFDSPSHRTVLLWHGQQSNARTSVRPLTELLAGHGLGVVVPDWDSHVDDGDGLVLVGWSMGGVAAAGLTIAARRLGIGFAHTVCLAGAFMVTDPIFGRVPAT